METTTSSSSDPLLTTLCSVCRTNPPRYKCPRCNLPYCSVPCNRRHRARAGCSGIRDVTTFVPRSRLCTAAGIDRDYNFLQGIDVARASAVKHVVDDRRVLRTNDVQARVLNDEGEEKREQERQRWQRQKGQGQRQRGQNQKGGKGEMGAPPPRPAGPALVRHWQGEEVVFVPARKLLGKGVLDNDNDASTASTSYRVRTLCRKGNVELLGAPRGFSRQRENNTTVATTTTSTLGGGGRVSEVHLHWQVEWLMYGDDEKPARVLRRAYDNIPLYRAYVILQTAERQKMAALVDEVDNETESKKKKHTHKKRTMKPTAPFVNSFFWGDSIQEASGAWRPKTLVDPADDEAHRMVREQFSFYLLRPRVSGVVHHAQAKELIPLDAADTLSTVLWGRSVLEFPTIYVIPTTQDLPAGHVLSSTARRMLEPVVVTTNGKKGKGFLKRGQTGDKNAPSAKKQKTGSDEEDGEVDEDVDVANAPAVELESETSSSGTDSSDEEESEEDSDSEEEGEEKEEDPNGLPALVPNGLGGGSLPASGKSKLVVYDSWSEGSDEE
ncbi:Box C/D snoRNA accumulation [Sporothrix eucalyptigena]|uniref:Box C/D snoRNA accumulation n=1 Tax=Sporothrix eucalyptigena TaxID=1812306 RepID=A0ABP0C0F2_9PEZI